MSFNLLFFLASLYILFPTHRLGQDLRQNKNNALIKEVGFFYQVHLPPRDVKVNGGLMCSATLDVATQPWVRGQLHPFPDFSINWKCRDFGAILDWHEETMITDFEGYTALRMPEGHVPYEMSEFYRAFGVGEEDHHH
ncbi:hypothetical protein BDW71DRAFT_212297 [Aspergillus fruticulosus]